MSTHPDENVAGPKNADPQKPRRVSRPLILVLLLAGLGVIVYNYRVTPGVAGQPKMILPQGEMTRAQKAYRLMQQGVFTADPEVSRESFKKVIELYGDDTDELARYSVAVSRVNLTNYIEDAAEKKRLLDPVIAEYKETVDIHSRLAYHVARAMNIRAPLFDTLDDQKSMYREVIDRYSKSGFPLMFPQVVRAYCELAILTSDPVEKVRLFDAGITAYNPQGDGDLQYWVARSMNNKARALTDPAESLAVLDELLNKFINSRYPPTQVQVVWAITGRVNQTEDPAMKLASLDALVRKFGESEEKYIKGRVEWARRQILQLLQSHFGGGKLAGIYAFPPDKKEAIRVLSALRKEAEAAKTPAEKIALYDMIIDKGFKDNDPGAVRAFFRAVEAKAGLLSDNAEKIALYDLALAKVREHPSLVSMFEVEKLLNEKIALQDDSSAKTAFFDAIIEDNRDDGAVAGALMAKARNASGIRARRNLYEEIVTRFKDSDDPAVLGTLGSAYQSLALWTDDPAEKDRLYDETIAKFSVLDKTDRRSAILFRYAPEAMLSKAENTKDKNEKIRLYDEVIDKFKGDTFELSYFARRAAEAKARLTGDASAAVRMYDEVIARGGEDFVVAYALLGKADILDDDAQKVLVYDEILAKFGANDEHRIQNAVANARFGKARAVADKNEKIKLYRDYIERYAKRHFAGNTGNVGEAYEALIKLAADKEEKRRLHDDMIAMYADNQRWNPWARALLDKAKEQDDAAEKIRIYDQIIENGELANERFTKNIVIEAMFAKAEALPDKVEKIAIYDAVLAIPGDKYDILLTTYVQRAIVEKAALFGDHSIISDYYDNKIAGLKNVDEIAEWTKEKGFALSRYSAAKK